MTATLNQRRFTRVPLGYRVKVVGEEGTISSPSALNLSMSGVLVQTSQKLKIGSFVHVIIFVLGESGESRILAWGAVVRHERAAIAIEFTKIHGKECLEQLERLVMAHAHEPHHVARELETRHGLPAVV